jgi:colicin import membrane protein
MTGLAWSAVLAALVSGAAAAAPLEAPAWAIAPEDASCRTDIELTGRSGATVDVALVSDGQRVSLRFAKADAPAEAFLPIRIDQKPFANLVLRGGDAKVASMELSEETLAALRKGSTLQIAWLADEAVRASLTGSDQGLTDLKTCGAQVAARHQAKLTQTQADQARADADARAKAVADEQLAAARAQTAAAKAEQRRLAAEADKASAEADRQRALAEADRRRTADAQRQAAADDDDGYGYPYQRAPRYPQQAAQPWGYYSPYYPR